jgi:transcriptional regulator with XRE-family HTH domain
MTNTSTQTAVGVPQWDVTDRLRKSLRTGKVSVQEMAELLGVDRKTVGNYLNGRTGPSVATLRVWAMRCGVRFDWLRDGVVDLRTPDPVPGQEILASGCTGEDAGQVIAFPIRVLEDIEDLALTG